MSNNDLYCSKCKSQHHPVDCPLDELNRVSKRSEKIREILEVYVKDYQVKECLGRILSLDLSEVDIANIIIDYIIKHHPELRHKFYPRDMAKAISEAVASGKEER